MSPYESIPHVTPPGGSDDDKYSYHSPQNPDPDSSDAAFSSDSDAVSIISEVGNRPGHPKFAGEDASYSSEEERNAAIDAQAALLKIRYHQSTLQVPDRWGETTAIRTHFRYANVETSPIPTFTEQCRGRQALKRSIYSYQRCLRGSVRQGTSEKPTRRVTMPRTSAQSQFPRDTGSVSEVENSDPEPFTRSTVIIPWGPHSTIKRHKQGITEHGLGITMDRGSETAGGSSRQATQPETLGCEYRVW